MSRGHNQSRHRAGSRQPAYAAYAAGDDRTACALLSELIADQPGCGMRYVVLGEILAETGRSAEAVATIERGISADPAMIGAWNDFARNKKFTSADESLIAGNPFGPRPDRPYRFGSPGNPLCPGKRTTTLETMQKPCGTSMPPIASAGWVQAPNQAASPERSMLSLLMPPWDVSSRAGSAPRMRNRFLIVGMPRSAHNMVEQIL